MKARRKSNIEGTYKKPKTIRSGVHPSLRKAAVARTRADTQSKIGGHAGIQRGITARRLAEEALRESEALYRQLLRGVPVTIYTTDERGFLTLWNEAAEELWGRIPQAGQDRWCGSWKLYTAGGEFLPHEQCPMALAITERRIIKGVEAIGEKPDGTRFSFLANASPLYNASGAFKGAMNVMMDITERKQIEEALKESEERFRLLSDVSLEGIQIHENGVILDANLALAKQLGYRSPDEFIGKQIMHKHLTPESLKKMSEIIASKAEGAYEVEGIRSDGMRFPVEITSYTLNLNGKDLRIASTRDITVRKRAEAALRASEERFRQLSENAVAGILISNVEGKFLFANKTLAHMLEFDTVDELLAVTIASCYKDPKAREHFIQTLRSQGSVVNYEIEMLTQTGRSITTLNSVRLDEETLFGTSIDITERKRAEEERRQLEARMQQAQKLESLGVLAGGIAHDFNNLLTSMLGYASLALMELPAESVACPMLREIEQAARRAADLTQQLLAYSGRGKFVIQVLQLDTLVREMTKLLETVISKKAALHLDLAPATIEADATQIRQIVMNLITNASDALEGQPGVIEIRTGVRHADAAFLHSPYIQEELPAGDYAYVEVEDNGCGMTEETLVRLFDPFFTTKFTGRGLGLAAVLGIAKGHQGTIKVASAAGQGSVFQAFFPCARTPAGEVAIAGFASTAPRGQGTVLIVEDEESIRSFTRRILERAGFHVREAADGRAGLNLFGQYAPEIVAVLLDLTMPRLDGQEVLQQLRRLDPNIPVLVMSGYSDLEVSARFARMGASAFIQKPFHPRDLSALVCQMVPAAAAHGGR